MNRTRHGRRRRVLTALLSGSLAACGPIQPRERPGRAGVDYRVPPTSDWAVLTAGVSVHYDVPPKLRKQSQPKYPKYAFNRKIQGVVLLAILIDSEGSVAAWKVLRSIPELDGEAVECVRRWKFEPARKDGQPIVTIATAPVTFRIF